MISLVSLIKEADLPAVPDQNLPAQTPQVDRVESDVENIKNVLAQCLEIDPSEIQVRKSEKASIEDYADLSMTGDILISCPAVKKIGAEKTADLLNRLGFLEDIKINGQSGPDLSALVFGDSRKMGGNRDMFGTPGIGDMAGGDIIITSKTTEMRLVPFLARMGVNTANCEDAMEQYWRAIGGRAISDTEIMRYQQQLAAAMRPRLGMRGIGALPRGRQALPIREDGENNSSKATVENLVRYMGYAFGPVTACEDTSGGKTVYRLFKSDWAACVHLRNICKKKGFEVKEGSTILNNWRIVIGCPEGYIVMTTKGRSGSREWVSKSVYDKIPHSPTPVWGKDYTGSDW